MTGEREPALPRTALGTITAVATAVPAFIGYTERADHGGRDLKRQPCRVASMADYERCFGGPPVPRFRVSAVDDLAQGAQPPVDMTGPRAQVSQFTLDGRTWRLARPAGRAGGVYRLHQALRHFFQNGGGPCYIVSVGCYGDAAHAPEPEAGDAHTGLLSGLLALRQEAEPTLVVVPDAVSLSRADCAAVQRAVLMHCGHEMKNRFAILDVWGGELPRQATEPGCIEAFRADIGSMGLAFGAAYYPWLHTDLMRHGDFHLGLIDFDDGLPPVESLPTLSPLHVRLRDEALAQLNLMPPSAAMAGVYTMVDQTRGVWRAPANVSLAGVVQPAVPITAAEQEDLNVSIDGRSINALRSFIGQGVLVWGARTLDGNSLDGRYINVRRTLIMLEESCKLAVRALVFEPTEPATWQLAKSMLTAFLTGVWQRGGLAGAVPEDAFSLHVGLNESMTAEDVAEGLLRVTVLVAIARPAEFIEITFQQPMRAS